MIRPAWIKHQMVLQGWIKSKAQMYRMRNWCFYGMEKGEKLPSFSCPQWLLWRPFSRLTGRLLYRQWPISSSLNKQRFLSRDKQTCTSVKKNHQRSLVKRTSYRWREILPLLVVEVPQTQHLLSDWDSCYQFKTWTGCCGISELRIADRFKHKMVIYSE